MAARKYISLKTKLSAAICQLFLTHEEATALSEDQVLSLVQWDHYPIPHAHGGPDTHDNLMASLIPAHREKTVKVDVPQIAKTKRISREQEEFRKRLMTPREDRPVRKSRIQSRPFQKRKK